ncbi:MAG TPA: hypothetical protein VKB50_24555 [Vicinamibacterales bacterium]|nr:hypothetical protein [Vicinamibacterales bacterium]
MAKHRRLLWLPALSLIMAACASAARPVPQAPPADVQIKLATLSRVWVAGFVSSHGSGTRSEFDLNVETVRLVRSQLRAWSSAQVLEAEPLVMDTERRLSDVAYWRVQGEEHGWPLIVTGSVKLNLAPPKVEQRGRRTMYFPMAGRVLEATVVLIDGRSGEVLSTNKLPSRMRYGIGRFASSLSLFLQMMDQAMPDWVTAIADNSARRREPR